MASGCGWRGASRHRGLATNPTSGVARAARLKLALLASICLMSLAVYLATLAPTITWRNEGEDSGELATAAYILGIPHPPGYPTYVLLGKLFTLLPFGEVAYRLNLMSALFAALSAGIIFLISANLLHPEGKQGFHLLPAATAALMYAFSPVLWSQATIAEVYALNALFAAVAMYLALRIAREKRGGTAEWAALGLTFGLGLGNHLSLVLLLPTVLTLTLPRRSRNSLLMALLSFLIGLGCYLYPVLRAGEPLPVNWAYPGGLSRLWWLISAAQYRDFAFGLPLGQLPGRLTAWAQLLVKQFGPWGLLLGMAGFWQGWERERRQTVAFLATFGLISIYAFTYNTADSYVYLIPAYATFALWVGEGLEFGVSLLTESLTPRWHRASAFMLLLPAISLAGNFSSQNLSADREALSYGLKALGGLERGAIVIAESDAHTFALWYCRYTLLERPDVAVLNAGLLQYGWYREQAAKVHPTIRLPQKGEALTEFVEANLAHHPLYLTYPDQELSLRYLLVPEGGLYRLRPKGGL